MSPPTSPQEFQDPLENYEPKHFDDPLEKALVEETVAAIKHQPFASVPPETPVYTALERLAGLHVACLLVQDNDQLVGVFSDRDALDKVALEYDEIRDRPVSEVMTKNPVFIYESDSSAAALAVMAISGYRHVPVVDLDGKITGIVSPHRVTEFLQRYFHHV